MQVNLLDRRLIEIHVGFQRFDDFTHLAGALRNFF